MSKSVYIEHMGCPRRAMDASKFEKYFLANGFTISNSPKKANYILFVTCAVRKIVEDYAITRIQELSRYKAELIVGGCLKGINEERLYKNFKGLSFAVFNNEDIDKFFPEFKIKFNDLPDANFLYPRNKLQIFREYFFTLRLDLSFLKRVKVYLEKRVFKGYYYLRIGCGCIKQHCGFCVIWRAIGKLKSKPIETCLTEFRKALENGYKNIILVADNPGAYGLDINMTFVDLLSKLLEVDGDYNIEIEGLHPFWLIKYLDGLTSLLQVGKIRLILCPIQSSNDRILKLMNRRHNKSQLKEALLKIKNLCHKLKFHTHIIAGFPSETEEEFKETLNFVREVSFDLVKIYGYSKNPYITDPKIIKQEITDKIIRRRINKAVKFCRKYKIACATA